MSDVVVRSDDIQIHEGRATEMTVSVRLRPDEAETLVMLSRRYDTSLSDTLRLALGSLANRGQDIKENK